MLNNTLYVLVGPTACGKTALGVEIAKKMNAEIVSADSVQVYKKLDIGSAKPTVHEMQGIVHHMIDCIELDCPISVAEYQKMAFECIEDIHLRKKNALIVGGTGLYIDALTKPMDFAAPPPMEDFRQKLLKMQEDNPGCLHIMLEKCDPESALRLHKNDIKRVIRALEVYEVTGKTITEFSIENAKKKPKYSSCLIGLTMQRDKLYKRIEQRVDVMVENGLIEEVRQILAEGFEPSLMSLQGLGYKEIIGYLNATCTKEETLENIKQGTRRFAKRQWTWFNRDERINWLDADNCSNLLQAAEDILHKIAGEIDESI